MIVCCPKSHRTEWIDGNDEDGQFHGGGNVVVNEAALSFVVHLGIY